MKSKIFYGEVNKIVEWHHHSSLKRKDPFNTIMLYAIVSLSGKEWKVPAFWRGGEKWSVRFSPAKAGKYEIVTVCSDRTDHSLHNVTFTLEISKGANKAVVSVPSNLEVAHNKYLIEENTRLPFFWLADTWWMGLSSRLKWPQDFQTLVKDRKDKGFTVVLLVAGLFPDMDVLDERGKNEAGFPWDEEFTQINPNFFDEADKRIEYLVNAGLTPCILGSWGYYLSKIGEEKMQQHWHYLIARWSAYPIVWCVAGEASMPYYLSTHRKDDKKRQIDGWTDIARYIRKVDPFRRLVTIHPTEIGRDQINDESLLDFNMLQTGHSGYESVANTVRLIRKEKKRQPLMPIIIGEVNYEGLMHDTSAEVQRLTFWTAILSGATGFTYGANGIWQVNTKNKPFGKSPHGGNWGNTPWDEACLLPGTQHIALAKQLLLRFEWWNLEPHSEWISPQQDPENRKTPRIAGIEEKLRIIYFYGPIQPWAEPKYQLLCLEAHIAYKAFFWDPCTGEEFPLGMVTANEKGEWDIPPLPTFDDWILVLHAVFSSLTKAKHDSLSKRHLAQRLGKLFKDFPRKMLLLNKI